MGCGEVKATSNAKCRATPGVPLEPDAVLSSQARKRASMTFWKDGGAGASAATTCDTSPAGRVGSSPGGAAQAAGCKSRTRRWGRAQQGGGGMMAVGRWWGDGGESWGDHRAGVASANLKGVRGCARVCEGVRGRVCEGVCEGVRGSGLGLGSGLGPGSGSGLGSRSGSGWGSVVRVKGRGRWSGSGLGLG